jgi:phosphatidylglycerophosphatase A
MFPELNARRSHRIARILYHPIFLFGWLKTQLERRESNGEDKSYEVVDEILTGISIEMVFVDWMNRLQCLIDGNGGYVS